MFRVLCDLRSPPRVPSQWTSVIDYLQWTSVIACLNSASPRQIGPLWRSISLQSHAPGSLATSVCSLAGSFADSSCSGAQGQQNNLEGEKRSSKWEIETEDMIAPFKSQLVWGNNGAEIDRISRRSKDAYEIRLRDASLLVLPIPISQ